MKKAKELAVFVYGTLKPGERSWAECCEGRVVAQQEAKMRGRLFDLKLAGYPAVADEGWSAGTDSGYWIRGWRLVLKDAAALAALDRWEGYAPGRAYSENDYTRVRKGCYGKAGQAEPLGETWVYVMAPGKIAALGGVELPEGVWTEGKGGSGAEEEKEG